VTGAARGIGAGVAERLAADGFAVAVLDLDERACGPVVDKIRMAGGEALGVGVDVADEDAVTEAVGRVAAGLGDPTVLINNAGIIRDNLLFKMTTVDWDAVMGVHLRGAFLMSRAVQGYMVEAGWGRIVNLSSSSALGNRGQANYSAAKAGVIGFAKALALENANKGVTVNVIAPGYIATEMVRAVPEEVLKSKILPLIPVGRLGEAEEVARGVLFLASDDAGFVTGSTLSLNGGQYMA
jgi:3-oxoacyl-[acyl-carrier protein] reductase